MRSTRGVDEISAFRQQPERACVEDTLGLARERQKADEDVALRKERRKFLSSCEACYACDDFPRATPAGDRKPEIAEHARRASADLAHAQNSNAGVFGSAFHAGLKPDARFLCRIERALMTVMHQHVEHDVLRHF